MSIESFDAKGSPQIFRLRTQSTVDDSPFPPSKEGNIPREGGQKGKVIGVFTSGGDSQGLCPNIKLMFILKTNVFVCVVGLRQV